RDRKPVARPLAGLSRLRGARRRGPPLALPPVAAWGAAVRTALNAHSVAQTWLILSLTNSDPHEAFPVMQASDLEMLVIVGGLERTTDEYATLLARSGLRLIEAQPV